MWLRTSTSTSPIKKNNKTSQKYVVFFDRAINSTDYIRLRRSLKTLYSCSQHGQQLPDTGSVLNSFKEIIKIPEQIYVIIDVLDECWEVPRFIEEIVSWKSGNLHLLTTSRKERERDIEEAVESLVLQVKSVFKAPPGRF